MAKSDSFFIRASVTCGDTGLFEQTPIDLGAYVSALGKSVLKIKSVHYEWIAGSDATVPTPFGAPYMDAGKAGEALMQLTTQTQTAIVSLENKSVIAKASLWARNPDASNNPPATVYNDSHSPQDYADAYIVAVETMYLGAVGGTEWTDGSDLTCAVMIECQVETLTQASAMALALSQQ
tara:strand:- start:396 stop:932 length:537 start_codon:yes stop_codon:yes gene_type:complete